MDHDAELNKSAMPASSPAKLVRNTSEPINSATPIVPTTSPSHDLPVGFTLGGTTAPSSAMMIASVDIKSAANPDGTRFSAQYRDPWPPRKKSPPRIMAGRR